MPSSYDLRLIVARLKAAKAEPAPVDVDFDQRLKLVRAGRVKAADIPAWAATERPAKR